MYKITVYIINYIYSYCTWIRSSFDEFPQLYSVMVDKVSLTGADCASQVK